MASQPRLVLLGKQGAGKGTQSVRLAAHYGISHVATGDMFRAQAAQGTAFGLEAKRYMDAGELVPDEIVIGVIEECTAPGGPLGTGFVLDGFPRNLAQADALDAMLGSIGRALDAILFFDLPDDVAVERLLGRAAAENRPDDTPEVIARRLEIYHAETEPIVEHYRATGRLVPLHAGRTVDEVWREIEAALGSLEAV